MRRIPANSAAALATLILALAGVHAALAQQSYPEKPIRIVSPFPPGGAADTLARSLAQKLIELAQMQAFVENRTGAGGTIGTEFVAKSAADGYTLLLGNVSTLGIAPSIYAKEGLAIEASTPEALAQLIRSDVARWSEVVKRAGIKLE